MSSATPTTLCRLECIDIEACPECTEHRDLSHKLAALRVKVNARADLLTSRFPVEIVGAIFEAYVNLHAVDTTDERYESHTYERPRFFEVVHRSAPLKLGSVCHRWRQLAWFHRKLWTALFVYLPCPGHKFGAELVNQWLTRAGDSPVDIRIDDKSVYHCNAPDEISVRDSALRVIQEINKFARIWRGFEVAGLSLDVVEMLDDSKYTSKNDPSLLRSFSFGGATDTPHGRETQWILRHSKRKHRPTHLAFMSEFPFTRLNIDWSHITNLHLSDMSRRLCFSGILRVLHSPLMHLALSAIDDYNNEDLSWAPVARAETLPLLTFLSLSEDYTSSRIASDIFDHFKAPNLHSFEYSRRQDGPDQSDTFPIHNFIDFIHRSGCQLQSAGFLGAVVSDSDLLRALTVLPTLKTLRLHLTRQNDIGQLFERLSQLFLRTDNAPFLPVLSHLDITSLIPKKWSSLIGMYDDNPSTLGNPPYISEQAPARKALKVNLRIFFRDRTFQFRDEEYMDTISVVKLAYLWKVHGVACTFQIDPQRSDADRSDMLDPTFVYQSWGHTTTDDVPYSLREEIWNLAYKMSNVDKWHRYRDEKREEMKRFREYRRTHSTHPQ